MTTTTTTPDILYLDDMRPARMKLVQTAQHAVVAATMAFAGFSHLRDAGGSIRLLSVFELAAAAALFVAIAVERRHASRGAHARFGWIEIASGILLFVEGYSKPHHKLVRPEYLSALVFIVLGVFDSKLAGFRKRRRSLEAREDSLRGRMGPFRRFEIPWSEVVGASTDGRRLEIRRSGADPVVVRLRPLRNADEAVAWLAERLRERAIPSQLPS